MKIKALVAVVAAAALLAPAFGQTGTTAPVKNESQIGRTLGTVGGIAGGFFLGLAVGLSKYDDAINSERKIATLMAVTTAAGGVGGYFLGRAIDKKRDRVSWRLDSLDRRLLAAARELRVSGERSRLAESSLPIWQAADRCLAEHP